ncbi:MAG TPA: hypothetical protein VFF47_00495 [Nitrospirota bacterium]|nr:hypothetical protein [Nitrospirota bacterium]
MYLYCASANKNETVREMMQAAMGDNAAVPGMIAAIQTHLAVM